MTITNTNKPSAGANAAQVFGEIANSTDTFKKASSVTIDALTIATEALSVVPGAEGVGAAFSLLTGQLKITKSVINATSLIGMGYEWGDPGQLQSITKTWQKTANRVFLTAGLVMETAGFIDKLSNKFLTQPSLCIQGSIPIFDLVKSAFFAISSFFGIWTASIELHEANRILQSSKEKEARFKKLQQDWGSIEKNDVDGLITQYQNRKSALENKGDQRTIEEEVEFQLLDSFLNNKMPHSDEEIRGGWQKYIAQRANLGVVYKLIKLLRCEKQDLGNFNKLVEAKKTELDQAKSKLDQEIANLNVQLANKEGGEERSALEGQLQNKTEELRAVQLSLDLIERYSRFKDDSLKHAKKYIDYRVDKHEAKIHNAKQLVTKSWLSIAAEVGKIFMIVVGTVIQGLALVFPVLKTAAVNLTMTGCSLASNSIGLAKNIYTNVYYKANLRKIPAFK